jgi:pimeloyl-ACP methyl ester carboxylesterase
VGCIRPVHTIRALELVLEMTGTTRFALVAATASMLAACGGDRGASTRTASCEHSAARPRLTAIRPCPGIPRFTCASLLVPLDHASQAAGTLHLSVGYDSAAAAPKGILLFLTGGPGQPGVRFIPRIDARLKAAMGDYRLVMFDQRGTGAGALRCPALQAAAGSSDLIPAPAGDVADCARRIGPARRYYTTPETLADIDELRRALGADRLTLDGVSYGTFVAERYALVYPGHVSRLVLDSVVPQQGADPLSLASLQATAQVLRSVCREQGCGWDPAHDVAALARTPWEGPRILDAVVAESIAYPSLPGILGVLHAAASGRPAGLERFLTAIDRGEATPAAELSQGLHEATLCLDLAPPWNPLDSRAQRAATVQSEAARLPASAFFPFDRATATGNGITHGCTEWPPTEPPALPSGAPEARLPKVPVLLLAGQRDLSTPLAWARAEAREAPGGRLFAVPGAGHSVQLRARDPAVRRILARFLGT